ncbi:MAG: NAD(P)-dependent oxidoreductase [Chloroflexota bacterium]
MPPEAAASSASLSQERGLPRIAFIGLGHMGGPMALNLARAGYPLTVYNRTREREQPLLAAGAASAPDVATTVATADVVLSCLRDPAAVREVFLGAGGVLTATTAGQILVDHGTSGIALARELAARATAAGADFVDAPVSGGPDGAAAGTLSIMAGGSRAAFDRLRPVLRAMGTTIRYTGPSGSGQALKLANQLLVIVHQMVAAEAFAFAAKAGIDGQVFQEVIPSSWGQSRMLERIVPRFASRSFALLPNAPLFLKDEALIEEGAAELDTPLPILKTVRGLLDRMVELGYGGDLAAALKLYEEDLR